MRVKRKKIVKKPMKILSFNYWKVSKPHIVTPWLDSDTDGVVDSKDCKPLDPEKQHTKDWEKQMLKKERIKRENAEQFLSEKRKGWKDDKIISRMVANPGSAIDKISKRYERVKAIPGSVGFDASDIRRTKDVVQFIKDKNLKDYGSEISFE